MEEPTLEDLIKRDQGAWRSAFKILYPIAYRTAKSPRINLNDADVEEDAKTIELKNPQRDKYFRVLAEVWIDGESLGEKLKSDGLAKDYDGEGG